MIKKIITVIVLLFVAAAVFSLAKTFQQQTQEAPKGKLPAGSPAPGAISDIQNQTWVWTETIMNNDTSIIPEKAGAFTITLADGKVSGKTDCNSFFSTYQIGSDGVISFGALGSTKMACEGSQESVFTDFISNTSRYILSPAGDLVLLLKMDSGSVMFKKLETKDITLGVGEKGILGDFSITFNKFVQDSRCPIDVQCIQAGAVNINVTMTDGVKTETKNFPSDEVPQTFGAYRISITNVQPNRMSKKEIDPKDYKITFHIEK